jgi:hypothetical protein
MLVQSAGELNAPDYQKVEHDLRCLLRDTGAVSVTTFIDYYGLEIIRRECRHFNVWLTWLEGL